MSSDATGICSLTQIQRVRVADDRERIERGGGSRLQRILQAREYKCRSKELYIVVKVSFDSPSL
jgi:hypothetical protein